MYGLGCACSTRLPCRHHINLSNTRVICNTEEVSSNMQIGIANPSMLHVGLKVVLEDKLRRSKTRLRQLYWQREHTDVQWRLCGHEQRQEPYATPLPDRRSKQWVCVSWFTQGECLSYKRCCSAPVAPCCCRHQSVANLPQAEGSNWGMGWVCVNLADMDEGTKEMLVHCTVC